MDLDNSCGDGFWIAKNHEIPGETLSAIRQASNEIVSFINERGISRTNALAALLSISVQIGKCEEMTDVEWEEMFRVALRRSKE